MALTKIHSAAAELKALATAARIGPAHTADIPAMVRLLTELFTIETDFPSNEVRQARGLELILADKVKCQVLVARINDQVVGMATAQLVVSTAEGGLSAWVEDVIVNREFRRLGIGSALIAAIELWARKAGALRMQLLTELTNRNAFEFYRANAWGQTGVACLRRMIHRL